MIAFPRGGRRNKLDQWSPWAELPVVNVSEGSAQAKMTLLKEKEELISLDVLMHYFDCTCAGEPLLQEVRAWQMLIKQTLSEDKLSQNRADRLDWKCCFPRGSTCGNVRALLFSKVLLGFKMQLQSGVSCYPAVSHKCNLNSCFLMECVLLIAQKSVIFFFFPL